MTAPEPRCERSDLPTSMCAHCRGHDDGHVDRLFATEVGPTFTASYRGRCDRCDGSIKPGDSIAVWVAGTGYVCRRCLP